MTTLYVEDLHVNISQSFEKIGSTQMLKCIDHFLDPVTLRVKNHSVISLTLVSETIIVWFQLIINSEARH